MHRLAEESLTSLSLQSRYIYEIILKVAFFHLLLIFFRTLLRSTRRMARIKLAYVPSCFRTRLTAYRNVNVHVRTLSSQYHRECSKRIYDQGGSLIACNYLNRDRSVNLFERGGSIGEIIWLRVDTQLRAVVYVVSRFSAIHRHGEWSAISIVSRESR